MFFSSSDSNGVRRAADTGNRSIQNDHLDGYEFGGSGTTM